jgi:hypothetical protein
MSYPRSLSYFLNYLSGYSKTTVKFYPQSPQTAVKSGSVIRVLLPQNTMVDMRSLIMNFTGTTTTANGFAAFPKHIETIIDSWSFEINSQPVTPAGTAQNQVFKILSDYHLKDRESARWLQNGAGANSVPSANVTAQQFSVYNHLGFTSTCLPEIIDTSCLGDCVLVIRLANTQPLCLSNTASIAPEYQLDNLSFAADIVSLDDGGRYYKFLQDLLATGNPIQIPYQYWVTFSSGPVNLPAKVLGSVSTQSLDMSILTCLPASLAGSNNVNSVAYTSDYFLRGSSNITSATTYVNNVKYPQFDLAPHECYTHSLKALNMSQDTLGWLDAGMSSLSNFQNAYFTKINRYNHATPADERWVSGIDTRGTMAQIRGELNGTTGSVNPYLFVQCTGTLRVKAFRQVDVIW